MNDCMRSAHCWAQAAAAGEGPSPRFGHSMSADAVRGVTLLFGGVLDYDADASDETWEWNGVAWRQVEVEAAGPTGRYGAGMVYDAARGVTVMFGGGDAGRCRG